MNPESESEWLKSIIQKLVTDPASKVHILIHYQLSDISITDITYTNDSHAGVWRPGNFIMQVVDIQAF